MNPSAKVEAATANQTSKAIHRFMLRWTGKKNGCSRNFSTSITAKASSLFRVVDAHDAAKKIDHAHIFQAKFAHFFRDTTLRGIMPQRFKDVSVSRSVAAKNFAEDGNDEFQVAKINCPPKPVVRFSKIKHEQTSARLGHTLHFLQARLPTGEISQSIANSNDLERIFRERNFLRIALNELNSGL